MMMWFGVGQAPPLIQHDGISKGKEGEKRKRSDPAMRLSFVSCKIDT